MKRVLLFLCFIITLSPRPSRAVDAPRLELKDGDRVAFIGNTFVEREQKDAYIETMLLSRFPDRHVTFRNLGYSADTATGEVRGLCTGWSQFEGPDKAFERLRKLVAEYKPTVLIINYGMTESFFGPQKLPEFVANYNKMLDALSAAAGGSPRWVLMSPNYHEDLGRPLPDPAAHNKNLRIYSDAIGDIAAKRGALFIDLMSITEAAGRLPVAAPLTWNGIHLTPWGYWRVAGSLQQALGLSRPPYHINLSVKDGPIEAIGTKISDVKLSALGGSFVAGDEVLPFHSAPKNTSARSSDGTASIATDEHVLRISGLSPGLYKLTEGDRDIVRGTADDFAKGVHLGAGSAFEQSEALRQLIVAKDFDYFNYQRPDNDSYILAFRKREQGRNAVEIPQFLPLVEQKEKEIAGLLAPKPVTYTVQLVK